MTNQTKHTPGPWVTTVIKRRSKITHWAINGTDEGGDNFTSGRIVDVPCNVPNHSGPTQEANARLIAAAPELLEALRDCVESLERLPNQDGAYRVTCIQQAKAAIAKATGGQS